MSTSLSKAIAISTIGWQKMLSESCSLEKALEVCLAGQPNEMKGVVQSLLYTTVRHRAKVELLLGKLVKKPPQENTKALLYIALALLLEGKEKAFTVVNQAVDAAKMNAETAWSSGFINAVLRNFLRSRSQLTASFKTNLSAQFNAPGWWISKVRQAYPNQWRGILSTQNKQPPLTVRVNRSKISVSDFLLKLEQNGLTGKQVGSWAVVIEPACPVNKIPGFFEGLCSIQDAGSQLVTELLTLKDGDRVLDACAAPGGKSARQWKLIRKEPPELRTLFHGLISTLKLLLEMPAMSLALKNLAISMQLCWMLRVQLLASFADILTLSGLGDRRTLHFWLKDRGKFWKLSGRDCHMAKICCISFVLFFQKKGLSKLSVS